MTFASQRKARLLGATDYGARRASVKPLLSGIGNPTLLLNARIDPFPPEQAPPSPSQVSSQVRLELSKEIGHVGFVSGGLPGRLDWLPQRLLDFLSSAAQKPTGPFRAR